MSASLEVTGTLKSVAAFQDVAPEGEESQASAVSPLSDDVSSELTFHCATYPHRHFTGLLRLFVDEWDATEVFSLCGNWLLCTVSHLVYLHFQRQSLRFHLILGGY